MSTSRIKIYQELVKAVDAVDGVKWPKVKIFGSLTGETDEAFSVRLASMKPFEQDIAVVLRKLDVSMPLERDSDAGVWETLLIENGSQYFWLSVQNLMGERENITTFAVGNDDGYSNFVETWSHCREASSVGDTAWDAARSERRTVLYEGNQHVIDRGANFVCDLLQQAGCEPYVSCEGHPWGAYVGFTGDALTAITILQEFKRLGWETMGGYTADNFIAYMKSVRTVEERDEEWRKLAREFNYDLLPGAVIDKSKLQIPSECPTQIRIW